MSVPDALSVCFSWTPFYLLLTAGRADEEREGSLHLRALEALGMASSLDPHDTGSRHRLGTLLVRLRVSPNPSLTLSLNPNPSPNPNPNPNLNPNPNPKPNPNPNLNPKPKPKPNPNPTLTLTLAWSLTYRSF